jgi:hypothetical protein
MMRRTRREPRLNLRFIFPIAILLLAIPALALAQAATSDSSDGPLQTNTDTARPKQIDNDTIIRMAKAGLDDNILLQTIQLQPGHYDTTPDDLIALKNAGVSQTVIAAMQAHRTGLDIRRKHEDVSVNPTPIALGIDEIGAYYKSKTGEWIELKTERVVFKSGGAAKSILTHGIISKDMNGHLDGPQSELVLPTGVEILLYTPAGTDAEEYDFLRFERHKDNREFRTLTGGVFHSESGAARDEIEFHPRKIGPQMYTFTVPIDIERGEYGVLPPGSANIQGIAGTGKIFTFSIRE